MHVVRRQTYTASSMGVLVWLESLPLAVWVRESPSVWAQPTVLTLHTMGMAVLVGASWVLDLRLLGISRNIPAVRLPLGLPGRRDRPDRQSHDRRPALRAARDNLGDGDTVSHQDVPGHRQRRHIGAAPLARISQRPGAARGQQPRPAPGDRLDPRVVRCRDRGPSSRLPGPIGGQMTSITAVNLTHLHLLLNHVPTVGSVVALGLLLLAFVRRDEHLEACRVGSALRDRGRDASRLYERRRRPSGAAGPTGGLRRLP